MNPQLIQNTIKVVMAAVTSTVLLPIIKKIGEVMKKKKG
jgi:hypothetical protein